MAVPPLTQGVLPHALSADNFTGTPIIVQVLGKFIVTRISMLPDLHAAPAPAAAPLLAPAATVQLV
jgi:hypothetical protein